MLRIDPALPLIWVSPTTVRIGAQRAVAVVHDVDNEIAEVLDRMHRGVVESEPEVVLGAARAARLLAQLAPALETARRPRLALHVTGASSVAATVKQVLIEDGHRVRKRDVDIAIPIAEWRIPEAERQRLLGRDMPHLPVVIGDHDIVIGPFTVPGRSACLRCARLADRSVNTVFPPRAGAPVPASAVASTVAAIAVAVNRAATHTLPPSSGAIVRRSSGEVRLAHWHPHAECGCQSLPGTETASAAFDRTPGRAKALGTALRE